MPYSPPDWISALRPVLKRGQEALRWPFSEGWCQTELFGVLKNRATETGWVPIPTEPWYVTKYPAQKIDPNGGNKLADLCLFNQERDEWSWLELKMAYARNAGNRLGEFVRDSCALIGIDMDATAEKWSREDKARAFLKPLANNLRGAVHHFSVLLIQIDAEPDAKIWQEEALSKKAKARLRQFGVSDSKLPEWNVTVTPQVDFGVWILHAGWTEERD